jgi:hypothetical protein
MKIGFILAMLVLIGMASAETVNVLNGNGNYTATFDMKQPHIIDNNNSVIRTYYGVVDVTHFDEPVTMPSAQEH